MKYSLLGIGMLTAILVMNQDTSGSIDTAPQKLDRDQIRIMEELPFEQATIHWQITGPSVHPEAEHACRFTADLSRETSLTLPEQCGELVIGRADWLSLEKTVEGDLKISARDGTSIMGFYETGMAFYESYGSANRPLVLEPADTTTNEMASSSGF